LIDSISVFSCEGFIKKYRGGRRIGVLSGSGGECTLVSDAASNVGVEVPELTEATKANLQESVADFGNMNNPLDGTGAMYDDDKIFPRLLQGLVDDANIDIVTINLEANDPRPKELKSGNRFTLAIEKAATASSKPIATFSSVVGGPVDPDILQPLRAAGVPIMEGAECATATIRNLADYYDFQKARLSGGGEITRTAAHAKLPSGVLGAEAAFSLFKEFNIPVAPTVLARTQDEAATAADKMGYPVVLKVESAQITHKSDVGGVALRLTNADEVRSAFANIQSAVKSHVPNAKIDGVIVQRMAGDGVEMILGIKRDPLFGPVVLCGLGGILVEVLKDIAVGIPPLSRQQAHHMLTRLRGFEILGGVRGKPAGDVEALSDAIVAISNLAASLSDQINGVDINPLIVLPKGQGVVAVDAVVEIQ
jgi:acetyltransferase